MSKREKGILFEQYFNGSWNLVGTSNKLLEGYICRVLIISEEENLQTTLF